jgi:cytochrome P450
MYDRENNDKTESDAVATSALARPAVTGCPHLEGFNPLLPDQVHNLAPWMARSREECPVFYMPEYDEWVVTRHEDCLAVLRDTQTFSNSASITVGTPPADMADELPFGYAFEHSMGNADRPRHTRLRKVAQRAFTQSKARAMEPEIRALCDETVDRFVELGQVDLIPEFCKKIPIRVITSVLKVSDVDAPQLYQWSLDLLELFGDPLIMPSRSKQLAVGQVEFHRYLRELMDERERAPLGDDDFVTTLLRTRSLEGDEALSELEVTGTIATMIFGGADTSAILIAHLVHSLLSDRSQWEELREHRELLETAVEESMRQRAPARGPRRTATREATIGGVTIPAGAQVWVTIWSANRDEDVFPNAETFDLHRPNVLKHLGWGLGTHYCIGTPLARAEARVAVACLLDRLPTLRLVPGHELEYATSKVIPTLLGGLVVEWDRADARLLDAPRS